MWIADLNTSLSSGKSFLSQNGHCHRPVWSLRIGLATSSCSLFGCRWAIPITWHSISLPGEKNRWNIMTASKNNGTISKWGLIVNIYQNSFYLLLTYCTYVTVSSQHKTPITRAFWLRHQVDKQNKNTKNWHRYFDQSTIVQSVAAVMLYRWRHWGMFLK